MRRLLFFLIILLVAASTFGARPKGAKNKPNAAHVNEVPRAPPPAPSLTERIAKTLKRKLWEPDEVLRDRSKRRRSDQDAQDTLPLEPMSSISSSAPELSLEEMHDLERKWHAVLEFLILQEQGKSTNAA